MWVLASRGRVENIKRFLDSWTDTEASTEVYFRLDECDPCLDSYLELSYPASWKVVVGERCRLGRAMNELFENYPNEDWYGLLADDLIPQTKFWDLQLIEVAGKNFISQANDLTRKPQNCCHPVIGGDLVRAAGWFALPECTHYCVELPWKEVTKRNPNILKYLNEVIVEHAHWRFDKALFDATYEETKPLKQIDHEIWNEWRFNEFDAFYNRLTLE